MNGKWEVSVRDDESVAGNHVVGAVDPVARQGRVVGPEWVNALAGCGVSGWCSVDKPFARC
jgi:hypothetical protein